MVRDETDEFFSHEFRQGIVIADWTNGIVFCIQTSVPVKHIICRDVHQAPAAFTYSIHEMARPHDIDLPTRSVVTLGTCYVGIGGGVYEHCGGIAVQGRVDRVWLNDV
jgi:hypothetical protein